MANNVNDHIAQNLCVGCGSCAAKCPKNCISMQEGDKGFLYPFVNVSECVDCGLCVKVCPTEYQLETFEPQSVYAARLKDIDLLQSATSGGAFTALAIGVLKEAGLVCGASWNNAMEVSHVCISSIDELHRLQGSKYVQSSSYNCFNTIKNALNDGVKVLYSGTGCQVAGLRSFLQKDYKNLFTIELVCHGVPSPGLFRKYIEWLSTKTGGKVTSFKFRSKHRRPTGEHSEFFYICNNKEYMGRSYEDPYYGSFLQGKTLRPSCYNCLFKHKKRVADITLGDFWGIEKSHPSFPTMNGHSLVIVNTDKGGILINNVSESLDLVESCWSEAVLRNHSLIKTVLPPNNDFNLNSLTLFDKDLAVKISFKDKIKNRIPWKMKWILKKYL